METAEKGQVAGPQFTSCGELDVFGFASWG